MDSYFSAILFPEAFIEDLDPELDYRIMMFVEAVTDICDGWGNYSTHKHMVTDDRLSSCFSKAEQVFAGGEIH